MSRAVAAGLAPRPVEETVRDTLAWAQAQGETAGAARERDGDRQGGIDPERERELLAEWGGAA